jgi:hypothetical protein
VLCSIADKLGVDVTVLVRINQKKWGSGLKSKSRFKAGTELLLPRGSGSGVGSSTSRGGGSCGTGGGGAGGGGGGGGVSADVFSERRNDSPSRITCPDMGSFSPTQPHTNHPATSPKSSSLDGGGCGGGVGGGGGCGAGGGGAGGGGGGGVSADDPAASPKSSSLDALDSAKDGDVAPEGLAPGDVPSPVGSTEQPCTYLQRPTDTVSPVESPQLDSTTSSCNIGSGSGSGNISCSSAKTCDDVEDVGRGVRQFVSPTPSDPLEAQMSADSGKTRVPGTFATAEEAALTTDKAAVAFGSPRESLTLPEQSDKHSHVRNDQRNGAHSSGSGGPDNSNSDGGSASAITSTSTSAGPAEQSASTRKNQGVMNAAPSGRNDVLDDVDDNDDDDNSDDNVDKFDNGDGDGDATYNDTVVIKSRFRWVSHTGAREGPRWRAVVTLPGGDSHTAGVFHDEIAAVLAADAKAFTLGVEPARLNFPARYKPRTVGSVAGGTVTANRKRSYIEE